MQRDRLFLLKPQFADAALPARRFYCTVGTTVAGLLAAFPEAAENLDVEQVDFPRPREAIVDLIGEANQSAPVLVLADDAPANLATGEYQGRQFVKGLDELLYALHVRHGFPEPHP